MNTLIYGRLLELAPALRGLRDTNRFIVPLSFALAVLAAYGADWLLSQARERARGRLRSAAAGLVAGALAAVGLVELWTRPIPLHESEPPEAVDTALAADDDAHALVELPYDGRLHQPRIVRNLASLVHGLPVLNGCTGYDPPLIALTREVLESFPDETSRLYLTALGVDRVLVHEHALGPHRTRALTRRIEATPWLKPVTRLDGDAVYAAEGVPPDAAQGIRRAVAAYVPAEGPPREVGRQTLRLTSATDTEHLAYVLDDDPRTRWTTNSPQRPGQIWFTVALDPPQAVSAVWLDTREAPADLARGLRIQGQGEDGRWDVLVLDHPHLPLVRMAAAPAASWDVLRVPPRVLKALRLVSTGTSRRSWASVYGLRLETP